MATADTVWHSGRSGVLAESAPLRLAVVTAFYFTQGVPGALFYIVVPTWLSVTGHSPAEIAAVIAAAGAAPSLKFIGGLFVDRFPYLPMGLRKPWILAGQALLCGSLLFGALFAGADPSIAVLSALALISKIGSSLQDIAVDGMIIDLFPERERARASGFTYSAQALGGALMVFLGGRMIESNGLPFVFAILAVLPVVAFVALLPLRERVGEKLAPWGRGRVHPHNFGLKSVSWRTVFGQTFGLLTHPLALLLLVLFATRFVSAGIGGVVYPIMATREAGWALSEFTDLQTLTGLASGIAGIAFSGVLLVRTGSRPALVVMLATTAGIFAAMALVPALRSNDMALTAFFYADEVLSVCISVAIFPLCMRMCAPGAVATQYALFMASGNVGRPIGAALAGTLGYEGVGALFLIVVALALASAALFGFVEFPDRGAGQEVPPDPAPVEA